KAEVRQYKKGESQGTVVAGGNGRGNRFDQLYGPRYVFVDRDHSVYVSERGNDRVMKWMKGKKEGIIVAGGQGKGNGLTQLSYPKGVVVDQLGTVYVADDENDRIMRWPKGATQGSVIVGGNGGGGQSNQLNGPEGSSFDRHDCDHCEENIDWVLASEPLIPFISTGETHSLFFMDTANWKKFRNKLDENLMIWNNNRLLNSTSAIEEYSAFITKSITSATNESVPHVKQTNTSYTITHGESFQFDFSFGLYSKHMEKAHTILLLKPKKDKQQSSSYRPIRLLSCMGKLLEKIIRQRLLSELDRRNILHVHQAGFRPKKITICPRSTTSKATSKLHLIQYGMMV
ncbi:unnamed protein product, partial [Rotaria magnacalcarata]